MRKTHIVEDNLIITDMSDELILVKCFDVCGIARTAQDGVALAPRHEPDPILLDFRLADGGLGTTVSAQYGRLAN